MASRIPASLPQSHLPQDMQYGFNPQANPSPLEMLSNDKRSVSVLSAGSMDSANDASASIDSTATVFGSENSVTPTTIRNTYNMLTTPRSLSNTLPTSVQLPIHPDVSTSEDMFSIGSKIFQGMQGFQGSGKGTRDFQAFYTSFFSHITSLQASISQNPLFPELCTLLQQANAGEAFQSRDKEGSLNIYDRKYDVDTYLKDSTALSIQNRWNGLEQLIYKIFGITNTLRPILPKEYELFITLFKKIKLAQCAEVALTSDKNTSVSLHPEELRELLQALKELEYGNDQGNPEPSYGSNTPSRGQTPLSGLGTPGTGSGRSSATSGRSSSRTGRLSSKQTKEKPVPSASGTPAKRDNNPAEVGGTLMGTPQYQHPHPHPHPHQHQHQYQHQPPHSQYVVQHGYSDTGNMTPGRLRQEVPQYSTGYSTQMSQFGYDPRFSLHTGPNVLVSASSSASTPGLPFGQQLPFDGSTIPQSSQQTQPFHAQFQTDDGFMTSTGSYGVQSRVQTEETDMLSTTKSRKRGKGRDKDKDKDKEKEKDKDKDKSTKTKKLSSTPTLKLKTQAQDQDQDQGQGQGQGQDQGQGQGLQQNLQGDIFNPTLSTTSASTLLYPLGLQAQAQGQGQGQVQVQVQPNPLQTGIVDGTSSGLGADASGMGGFSNLSNFSNFSNLSNLSNLSNFSAFTAFPGQFPNLNQNLNQNQNQGYGSLFSQQNQLPFQHQFPSQLYGVGAVGAVGAVGGIPQFPLQMGQMGQQLPYNFQQHVGYTSTSLDATGSGRNLYSAGQSEGQANGDFDSAEFQDQDLDVDQDQDQDHDLGSGSENEFDEEYPGQRTSKGKKSIVTPTMSDSTPVMGTGAGPGPGAAQGQPPGGGSRRSIRRLPWQKAAEAAEKARDLTNERMKRGNSTAGSRSLPEASLQILRGWLFDHFDRPYPNEQDKEELAALTGLSKSQVNYWMINARVRIWKPVVKQQAEKAKKK